MVWRHNGASQFALQWDDLLASIVSALSLSAVVSGRSEIVPLRRHLEL